MRKIFVSVQCARNAPEYFADRLWRSMKGAGTNDSLLIRLVVSRSEVSRGYFSNHLFRSVVALAPSSQLLHSVCHHFRHHYISRDGYT